VFVGGALIATALVIGSIRQRIILAMAIAAAIAIAVGLDAIQRSVGFGAQGRHVLPFAAAAPVLAGEIVFQARAKLGRIFARLIPFSLITLAALVQLFAWYTIARRYTVGQSGPRLFFGHPGWAPYLGWAPWTSMVLAGTGLMAAFAWLGRQSDYEQGTEISRSPPHEASS